MSDEKVTIKKDGFYLTKWDKDQRKHVTHRLEDHEILSNLRNACYIDDGVIILNIFEAVDELPSLCNFLEPYSWCNNIHEFHANARLPREEEITDGPMELVLYYDFQFEENPEWSATHNMNLSGFGPDEDGQDTYWGIELSQPREYAHLIIRIKENAKILQRRKPASTSSIKYHKYIPSLLEVLDGIYWEISFLGSPEKIEDVREELLDRKERIELGLEETHSIEDVFNDEEE